MFLGVGVGGQKELPYRKDGIACIADETKPRIVRTILGLVSSATQARMGVLVGDFEKNS